MIVIKVSELRKFLASAKAIKENRLLPILGYVKLECEGDSARLTKTNLHAFVVCEIKADFSENVTMLIDEQVLSVAANYSKGDELRITIEGNDVVMDDGFSKTKCKNEDHANFPAVESPSVDKSTLDSDFISSLIVAKAHAAVLVDKDMRSWMTYIHVRKTGKKVCVAGVNGAISYFKLFKEAIPEMSLDHETISAIDKYSTLEYSTNGSYDFFTNGSVMYGFIKGEVKCPDFDTILEKFKSENSFIVSVKDMCIFCEKVVNLSKSNIPPEVSIEDGGKSNLILKYESISNSESSEEKIVADKKTYTVDKILMQPKNFLTAVKDLGVEKIKISKIFGNMIISSEDDKDYTGSVMELAKM